jgi:DNA-binding transcriptional MerR regulator
MSVTGKSSQAFRTIAEASEELDVPAHVLRFWEGKFTQLRPLKRAGGRRHYRPDDMALLRGIRALLQEDGYQLKGVQKLLRDEGISWVRDRGQMTAADENPKPVETSPPVSATEKQVRDQSIVMPQPEPASGPLFEQRLDHTHPDIAIRLRKALAKLETARKTLDQAVHASP